MSATFKSLSELLEKVEATKKRLEIIDLTANYLKTLNQQELRISRVRDDKTLKKRTPYKKLKKYMKGSLLKKANIKLTNNKRVRVQQVGCGREEKFCN